MFYNFFQVFSKKLNFILTMTTMKTIVYSLMISKNV